MSPLMLAMASMACPLAGQYEMGLNTQHTHGHHSASWSRSSKHRQWIPSRELASSNQTLLPAILWINATTLIWAANESIIDSDGSSRIELENRQERCDCFDFWSLPGSCETEGDKKGSILDSVGGEQEESLWRSYWKFYGRLSMLLILNCYFAKLKDRVKQ